MKPYKFRIVFSGLCAYVPNKEIRPYEPPYKFDVVLVNAVETSKALFRPIRVDGSSLRTHFPIVRYRLENVVEVTGNLAENSGVWRLDKEELYLDCEKSDTGMSIILDRVPAGREEPDPDDPGEERDFRWVPELDKVLPGAGKVSVSLVDPGTGDETQRVAAVVHLREGVLSSLRVAKPEQPRKYIVSQFTPPPLTDRPPVRQAIAFEVALEIDGLNDPITIRSFPFNKEIPFRAITLQPKESEDSVEIRIMNLCSPDVIEQMTGKQVPRAPMPGVDEDFKWFYILPDEASVGDRWTPIPVPVKFPVERTSEGGGQPAICTGCVTRPPQQD